MSHRFILPGLALLAALVCCSCTDSGSAGVLSISEPSISAGKLSLAVESPDPARLPLYDRVDLLLLPASPADLPQEYAGSTEYYEAIRTAQGFYMGGDYLEDAERSSGTASYELALPVGTIPPGECSAWLVCLALDGTAVEIQHSVAVTGWPE